MQKTLHQVGFEERASLPPKKRFPVNISGTWGILIAALMFAGVTAAEPGAKLPLADVLRLPDQTLPEMNQAVNISLPALPSKQGMTIILRFRMVSYTEAVAGCNLNGEVELNGAPISRYTVGGDERLIGRSPTFEFAEQYSGGFDVFVGPKLDVLFAPDVDAGDRATRDGLGATFVLDISDLVRGVDGNMLTIRNTRQPSLLSKRYDLIVRDIEVGWLRRDLLPKSPNMIPERTVLKTGVSAGPLRLTWGTGGGFAVSAEKGQELLVETGIGMKKSVTSDLIAADEAAQGAARVQVQPFGPAGFQASAEWPGFKLQRTVELKNGVAIWKERWTNTGNEIAALPFRHRLFLREGAAKFVLTGDTNISSIGASAVNPTIFIGSCKEIGNGFGVAAESDWLRLLSYYRNEGGVGEIYSETLALAPGSSIDFALAIMPVQDGGGYWTFINDLRWRWGLNDFCVQLPIFWDFTRAEGKTPEEVMTKSLGHLGPIMVAAGPWLRGEADIHNVSLKYGGQYPKLAAGAPPVPGRSPDFDVETFLTFKHRATFQDKFKQEVECLRKTLPQVKVIQRMHPSMETVYKPLLALWPYAEDAILTKDGTVFEDPTYSNIYFGEQVKKDWGILYFVPRPGSAYLEALLGGVRMSMDACGGDGIYCDEFSWAFRARLYSRYDYSRWDGYSADLDTEGKILRLKSDNAFETESCQLRILGEVLRREKFFLGNGGAALRSVNSLPVARFKEGGNGVAEMVDAHLANVPLILGNFGDEKTLKGIFDSVKTCLSMGCVYSPMGANLLLEGPDNFVCKLYPITILELGPGCVKGRERMVSTVSGSYAWPGRAATVRFYVYDATGKLLSRDQTRKIGADAKLELQVPESGMVIAEVMEEQKIKK
ncbi:MAG: hypothetical protein NT118_03700 [Lentisphaerae bacterium]|nr:hypothetical protein [Lentisphaerota bacterium]